MAQETCLDCGSQLDEEGFCPTCDPAAEGCPECESIADWNEAAGTCYRCGYDVVLDATKDPYSSMSEGTYTFDEAADSAPIFWNGTHLKDVAKPYLENVTYKHPKWDALVASLKKWPFFRLKVMEESPGFMAAAKVIKALMGVDITRARGVAFGPWIYMPKASLGTRSGYITLVHEGTHAKDFWRFGIIPFFLMQFILPIGPSLKAILEYRAYVETMKAEFAEYGSVPSYYPKMYARSFASKTYGYMFPFPKLAERIFEAKRRQIDPNWDAPASSLVTFITTKNGAN